MWVQDVGLDPEGKEDMRMGGQGRRMGKGFSGSLAVGIPGFPMMWWPEGDGKNGRGQRKWTWRREFVSAAFTSHICIYLKRMHDSFGEDMKQPA